MSYISGYNWVKNEKPLSEKALKEMAFVVDGILSGELEHDQEVWHSAVFDKKGNACGTAHCVAGWCELLGKRADKQRKSFLKVNQKIPLDKIEYYLGEDDFPERLYDGFKDERYAADYARDRWGLTNEEADAFFSGDNTKQQLKAFLTRFQKGMRIADTTYTTTWW